MKKFVIFDQPFTFKIYWYYEKCISKIMLKSILPSSYILFHERTSLRDSILKIFVSCITIQILQI